MGLAILKEFDSVFVRDFLGKYSTFERLSKEYRNSRRRYNTHRGIAMASTCASSVCHFCVCVSVRVLRCMCECACVCVCAGTFGRVAACVGVRSVAFLCIPVYV